MTTLPKWLRQLGPGLISGAADDDPSGIATYSQAGVQFGYQLAWTVVLTYPLMVGIQLVSARIGRVTGRGLAANVRSHFPGFVLYAIVAMLLIANTINIAADIAAMGDPIKALFWSAVINGVVALPIMVVVMLLAGNARVMGRFTTRPGLKVAGWLATATMGAAVVAMFAS